MSIIYLFTVILIIGLHMLIYKKDEQQNFLKIFALTIVLLPCYNIVICVILSFLKIKCTLSILSLINMIFGALLGFKIFKDKKIQKYYINKMDIIAIISIILLVFIITIKQYGIPLNLKSSTTDAASHYLFANEFYNYSTLLMEENSDILGLWDAEFLMPGAYINTGIIFKIFSPIIDETYFCQLFVMFDIGMWCLSGLLMYVLLLNNKKNNNIIPLIFSIIYMIGYPLNSLISGFSYLQIGLNLIISTLIIMQLEDSYYRYILLFFANFGLMFSYYYFAPVVFLAVFLQIILNIKDKKYFKVDNIIKILISLIIPGLFGVMYFIIFQHIRNGINPLQHYSSGINTPGPIYSNLITTILAFVLLGIYYIIKSIKNKQSNISNKMLILSIIYVLIIFIGMKLEKVSEYYYYKLYYMLWIFVITSAFNAIQILQEKNKLLIYGGIGLYCVGIIVAITFGKNILLFDIYKENFNEIKCKPIAISDKELEIFEYYNNNIDTIENLDETSYFYLGGNLRPRWAYALTKNPFVLIDVLFAEPFIEIEQFLNSDRIHCIIFKLENEEIYEKIEKIENIEILFKNDAGVIIKKY